MFIIGFIISSLYLWGLLTMIYRGHRQQREEFENDPEIRYIIKNFKMKMIMLTMMDMEIGEDLIHTIMMINTIDQKRKEKVESIMLVKK